MIICDMSTDAATPAGTWRFQSGPTKHLGVSTAGVVSWQKSTITGSGRLRPLRLHLVADIATGRVLADISTSDDDDGSAFLVRALEGAASLGGFPATLVFARGTARENPALLEIATRAGVTPLFGTPSFKLRQKISRHFEEFLHSRIVGHSSLGRLDTLVSCLPALVEAWNVAGQSGDEAIGRREAAAYRVINSELGPDPKYEATREFLQRQLAIREINVRPGGIPDYQFHDTFGTPFVYLGQDLCFTVNDRPFGIPLFALAQDSRNPRSWDTFNPNSVLLHKTSVPLELRNAWHIDDRQLERAISLRDVLGAMVARGAKLADLAGALRRILAACGRPPDVSSFRRQIPADVQPEAEILAAGVQFVNESWERIRERHFWRVRATWDTGVGPALTFARILIESSGRLNVLPEQSFFSRGSAPLHELLCSLFLRPPESVVPPPHRLRILAALREQAAARA